MSADLLDAQMPRSKSMSILLLMHYDTTSPVGDFFLTDASWFIDAQMPRSKSMSMLLLMHYDTTSHEDFFLTDVSWFTWCADAAV